MGLLLELCGGLPGSEHGLSLEQLLILGGGAAVEGCDVDVGQLRDGSFKDLQPKG